MNDQIHITKRELQVLELISQEYTSHEIARELYISTHTAESHRKNLFSKLGVRNAAGLVRKAFEYRLLTISFSWVIFLVFSTGNGYGQVPHLDVEGHVKIRGNIDIHHPEDSTTVLLGYQSGSLMTFTSRRMNTFMGSLAGQKNTSGDKNSFFGAYAGQNNSTGYRNSFFGQDAGLNNTDGDSNSFFGFQAGQFNTTGVSNTFIGQKSGQDNTSGELNTFLGSSSGKQNTTGRENTILGQSAGDDNTTGQYNTFVGRASGSQNISGSLNTFIGYDSGDVNVEGSRNTLLGAHSRVDTIANLGKVDRAIAIGHLAEVGCDNCAVIGGTGIDAVKVGIGTPVPTALLHIEGDNESEMVLRDIGNVVSITLQTRPPLSGLNWLIQAQSEPSTGGTASDASVIFQYAQDSIFRLRGNGNATLAGTLTENSDARLKTGIEKISSVLPQLLSLHAYTYDWKDRIKNRERQIGLMAQEVQEQFPELVQEDENGVLSVSYTRLVPLLIEGLKEQNAQLKLQETMIYENEGRYEELFQDYRRIKVRLTRIEKLISEVDRN